MKGSRAAVAALVTAVGLGAFLLFEIEFVSAKWLLPWFGGAASVWTTCMLFFQTGLLAGYVWAHRVVTDLTPRGQARAHLLLLGVAVALLAVTALAWPSPVTPGVAWRPAPEANPLGGLLVLLGVSVGLPFVVLATTGPLLQAWYTRLVPGGSPWPLYALSNLGSLLGVVLYPAAVEPLLTVPSQGRLWAALFVLYALSVALVARAQARAGAPERRVEEPARAPEPKGNRAFWWALSIGTSLGFLSVTNQLTLDVAVVPFLWTVPLVIYLGTFIWAFSGPGRFGGGAWGLLSALASIAAGAVYLEGNEVRLPGQVLAWLAFLILFCAFGHGELSRRKPEPARLTEFYLTIAAGGAVGGLVAAVAAPALFRGIWELPIALYLGLLLPILSFVARGDEAVSPGRRRLVLSVAGLLLFGAALALSATVNARRAYEIAASRNFYGCLQVLRTGVPTRPPEPARMLLHGRAMHGMQFDSERLRTRPTTYFGPLSGVGRTFAALRALERRPLRVGVVGLGVGTLAAWGLPGDTFRFYELDPAVIALSEGHHPLFTFLAQSRARVEVVPGDARLSLEREAPQRYDLLVLDAFSSDAIPVHLLTLEAFDVYLRHLAGSGAVIAVHVSNRNLRLGPVVRGAAARHGIPAAELFDDGRLPGTMPSTWVIATRRPGFLAHPAIAPAVLPLSSALLPFWTDASSNLLRSLWVFAGDEAKLYPTHRAAR